MYPRGDIAALVLTHLRDAPNKGVSEIAKELGLERHTLSRMLAEAGQSMAALRQACWSERLRSALAEAPESVKELAYAAGFPSPGAMQQFMRRHPESQMRTLVSAYFRPPAAIEIRPPGGPPGGRARRQVGDSPRGR